MESFGYNCLIGRCSLIEPHRVIKLMLILSSFVSIVIMVVSNVLTWRLARESSEFLRESRFDAQFEIIQLMKS